MNIKKTFSIVSLSFLSVAVLSGCNENDAEHFIGEWSGEVETTVGRSETVDTIRLAISENGNLYQVQEERHSLSVQEGFRDKESNAENTYNLAALSEITLGEPGAGEVEENVIYTYNEGEDVLIYNHRMFDGTHEMILKRD